MTCAAVRMCWLVMRLLLLVWFRFNILVILCGFIYLILTEIVIIGVGVVLLLINRRLVALSCVPIAFKLLSFVARFGCVAVLGVGGHCGCLGWGAFVDFVWRL